MLRWAELWLWTFGVWLILTWTAAFEQLAFGAVLAALVASAMLAILEIVAGLALAWWYLRHRQPRLITVLRAAHTGSVNDYAAFAIGGVVIVSLALLG